MDNLEELNKFPEIYNILRLIQEERENLNKLITINKIESIIGTPPTNKSPEMDGFYQIVKKELTINTAPFQHSNRFSSKRQRKMLDCSSIRRGGV